MGSLQKKLNLKKKIFEHWKSVCYAFFCFFKEMLILCTDSIRKWLLWSVTFLTYFTTRTLAGQKVQSQVFNSQSEKTEGYANINIFQIIYCVTCIWGTELHQVWCSKVWCHFETWFHFFNLILKPSEQLNMKSFMIFKWIFRVGMHWLSSSDHLSCMQVACFYVNTNFCALVSVCPHVINLQDLTSISMSCVTSINQEKYTDNGSVFIKKIK